MKTSGDTLPAEGFDPLLEELWFSSLGMPQSVAPGTTFISKAGITSSTFKAAPDAPFSSFELTSPQGRYSALAANGNLCTEASKLVMPATLVGQNGAVIHQSTKIAVTGCAKAHKAKTKHKKRNKR